MNSLLVRTSLLIGLFFLTGCDEQKYFKENLAKRWTDSFRKYQIHPTFTSREDVQVGDLLLTCELGKTDDEEDKELLPISILLTRFYVNKALVTFYENSVELPTRVTSDNATSDNKNKASKATITLKNAAFPEFLTAQVSGSDIGAALPTGKIMAGFGISSKDIESVSVSVPSVGTYQLPMADLIEVINEKGTNAKKLENLGKMSNFITSYGVQNCADKKPIILLVSEVYAANALKVDINLSAAVAANIKAALNITDSKSKLELINAFGRIFGIPTMNPPSAAPAAAPAAPADAGDAAAPADAASPADSASKDQSSNTNNKSSKEISPRLKEFKDYLDLVSNKADTNSSVGYPGVKISTYSGSFAGISIDSNFDRPVVIGVKGAKIDLCKYTKNIEGNEKCEIKKIGLENILPAPNEIGPAIVISPAIVVD